ncbi:transposase [Sporosarcina thermotolerans]|uniref:Transposase n=1 Tax=Sporosarcina thermotolerans TaxID=633404 RepID=A0AAW9AB11_9BACL|nr:transposase [Sporosarcina thermotolerans]MDW0118831.1 transposase [Sporosarcina thermotolerans]
MYILGKHQTQEFKEYICRLVVEEGRKVTQLSYETNVPIGTIRRWVGDYRNKLAAGKVEEGIATPSDLEKKLRTVEKELEDLREENEILKKAMHVFAKNRP